MITRQSITTLLLLVTLKSSDGFLTRNPHSERFHSSHIIPSASELFAQRGTGWRSNTKDAGSVSYRDHPLSTANINYDIDSLKMNSRSGGVNMPTISSSMPEILSASLLVTGNTFGAGCLVLPDLASGVGMMPFSSMFVAAYIVNLVSGLVLSEVAIQQREETGNSVPSSFKEFVQVNLGSQEIASVISAVSMFVNACVLCFDLSRIGSIGHDLIGIEPLVASTMWAGVIMTLMTTQSNKDLSRIASFCATALFISFGSLLLPGLQGVIDPIGTWIDPGTGASSIAEVGPVVVMAMVYQNIVPSITKLMEYDRFKTRAALITGSFIPLGMYLSWVYASLGGGIDTGVGLNGVAMTLFSMAALSGSGIGSGMSLSEEMETFVVPQSETTDENSTAATYNPLAVVLSVSAPLVAVLAFSKDHDMTGALGLAGSFGSPLLYGVIPALMAWKQRERRRDDSPIVSPVSLGCLGVLSSSLIGEELMQYIHNVI